MRRHPIDLVSLVFGLAFVALAAGALIADPIELIEARWLWPGLLIVLGLALLLAPLGGGGRRSPDAVDEAVTSVSSGPNTHEPASRSAVAEASHPDDAPSEET